MNGHAKLAILVTTLTAGCAATYRPLERGDWVKTYTAYEKRDALGRVYSPAPGAKAVVVTRAEYERRVKEGKLPNVFGLLGMRVSQLSEAKAIRLKVGEVKTYSVKEEHTVAISLRGDAALAFWTRPFQVRSSNAPPRKGSNIYVQGLARGEATLKLVGVDDRVTEVPITVK